MRTRSLLLALVLAVTAGAAHAQTSPSCAQIPNVVCDTGNDTISGVKTVTGTFDFTGGTLIIPNSTTAPACTGNGGIYLDSDAAAGARVKICIGGVFVNIDESGASGGDNISVDGAAASDANFIDGAIITFALNTGATPDEITATVANDSLGQAQLGTDSVGANELAASAITSADIGAGDLASALVWEDDCTSGTSCTLGATPRLTGTPSTILIVHRGLVLRRVASAPGINEFSISGATVTFNASQGVSTGADAAMAYYEL